MNTSSPFKTATEPCPAWCTDHTGFDDGSGHWHESLDVELYGFAFYASAGTVSGEPEFFMPEVGCRDGMSLQEAEHLAQCILMVVREVQVRGTGCRHDPSAD